MLKNVIKYMLNDICTLYSKLIFTLYSKLSQRPDQKYCITLINKTNFDDTCTFLAIFMN